MEYRILGSLEVLHDGEPVDVGSRRQRALLALLLLHPNRVVATDHILDALWGDDAHGRENALWVAVSRLRSALDAGTGDGTAQPLATRDHGYTLTVDAGGLDAARFEDAIRDARTCVAADAARAVKLLDEALTLWRGRPLGDLGDEAFARLEVARLGELRLEALELAAEARLHLGQGREQVGALEVLHREHPLREGFASLLMRSLYQGGRQADALRAYDTYRRMLGEELGVDPSPELRRLEELVLLHDDSLQRSAERRVGAVTNPFKGLRAFEEEDTEDYFGRDRLVADVLNRLREGRRLVALVGASGSGKSSAVRAGVIPAVRKGALERSEDWLIAEMVPGAHPLAELEAAILRSSLDAPSSLAEQLADTETGLLRAALRVLPQRCRLVLVIDQFEELFTLVTDDGERARFLDLLEPALDDPHGRVVVILTLRADFYDRPLAYPALARRIGDGVVNVSALTVDELEEAALQPALRGGVTLEPALLASLLSEVVGEPGALPLFQYTLTELFERRVGERITLGEYRDMGGLQGALAGRAEAVFGAMAPDEQAATRQLFYRLVSITADRDWSRRRVLASELVAMRGDLTAMQSAIAALAGQRLLTFDRDQVTGSPTVEVAHEALLTAWPRLRAWIDEARADVVRHHALVNAMREWEQAGRLDGYLLTGQRLGDYEQWSTTTLLQLNALELEFVQVSAQARDDADRRDPDRGAELAAWDRRRRRRAWSLAAALLLVVAGAGAWWLVAGGDEVRIAWAHSPGWAGAQLRNGWEQAQRDHDFEAIDLEYVSEPDEELDALLASGVDLVVLDVGADFSIDVGRHARAYPDTRFLLPVNPGVAPVLPANVVPFVIDAAEGSFLAGVAAAHTSRSGVIGFVGATPGAVDEFRVGYEAGARWAVPDIEVLSTYLDTFQAFHRPDLGRAAAARLYEDGADVVFHAAGPSGDWIPDLAAELGDAGRQVRWVIGVDVDQALAVSGPGSDHVLTSMLKRHDIGIRIAVARFLDGNLGPTLDLGLADGAVGWSETGGHLNPLVLERLRAAAALVRDGELTIPSVALEPPNALPRADATVTVTWTAEGCVIPELPALRDGDRLRLELVNESPEAHQARLGTAGGERLLVVPAAPGGTNAGVVQVSQETWSVWCQNARADEVSGAGEMVVAAVPASAALGRIVYDGSSCELEGSATVGSTVRAVYELVNASDEAASFGWGRLSDDEATLTDIRADWDLMWDGIGIGGWDLAPGESVVTRFDFGAVGAYAVNCWNGPFALDGDNHPAAVIEVVG